MLKMTRELKEECRAPILSYPFPIHGKFPLCNCSWFRICMWRNFIHFLSHFLFFLLNFHCQWLFNLLVVGVHLMFAHTSGT